MIGFPGIGLEFMRDPVIFRIGDRFAVTWYALILVTGLLLAVAFCLRQTKHFGIKPDEVYDMLFWAVPAGVIGARLYYVAFNWDQYSNNPLSILYTWEGGMAVYGSIIGSAVAAALFCRFRRIDIGAMLDLGSMGLLIGQAVGRWGNFVNGEVYGKATGLPWRMSVEFPRAPYQEVHPLFLYESLWNILGFVLLRFVFMKRRKFNGQMFMLYVAWYGLGRALLEGLRAPEYNLTLGGALISQVIAAVTAIAALILLFYIAIYRKHPPLLAWTDARDEHEAARKERKIKAGNTEPETVDEDKEKESDEKEAADDGGSNGREEPSEDGQE